MIKLYKFGAMGKVCDPSPFCVKVETYLKMAGIDHEIYSGAKYMRGSPKGKLPYIVDGDDHDGLGKLGHLQPLPF